MSSRLYVEGGGDSKALRTACRKGFSELLAKAGCKGRMPRVVACGSRQNAYESFVTALDDDDTPPILLVDAEGPVQSAGPWEHLHSLDSWARPEGASDDQCHLMVQVMESWFLADRGTLAAFFGKGFNERSLPGTPHLEQVPKADVSRALADATRATKKGKYHKGAHSFEILGRLDVDLLERASLHAKRFFDVVRRGEPRQR